MNGRTLTDYYTSNMDLRGGRHNGATNAQPPCRAANPSGQTAYTDHSILAVALATGLSTLNGTTLERAEELCRIMVSSRHRGMMRFPSCRNTPDRYRLVYSMVDKYTDWSRVHNKCYKLTTKTTLCRSIKTKSLMI